MADLPGGASGILRRDYKGRRADQLVTRIDPGVVSLLAISSATIALEISSRNARTKAKQKRWERLSACLELLLDERGMDCWCAATRGSKPTGWWPVATPEWLRWSPNSAVTSARRPRSWQWKTCVEERKPPMPTGFESEPPWQGVRTAAHGPIPLMGISHQESAAGVNQRFGRYASKWHATAFLE
jgi:hypothetical protein